MDEVALGNVNLSGDDFGDKRDNIFWRVLFSGGFCRDVGPFALDVFKRGDFGIVVGRKVDLRPLGDVLHENTFLAKFGNHAVEVKVFAIISTTFNAKQLFKLRVKTGKIFLEVLLKGFVVVADVRESLAPVHDVIVVATTKSSMSSAGFMPSVSSISRISLRIRPSSIISAKKGIM